MMVHKQCPNCGTQIPVACKSCPCGHAFSRKVPNPPPPPEETTDVKRRRTERVKRERPDYYSASEIENHIRRINKYEASVAAAAAAAAAVASSSPNSKEYTTDGGPAVKKRKPGRPKGSVNKPKAEGSEREDDVFANVSTEKALVYSVVLADINRKILSQWQGPPSSLK